MQNSRLRPAPRSRRTVLIRVCLIGFIGIGLFGFRWITAMRVPVVTIPSPAMPKPNAFDFYVAAGKGIINDQQIAEAFGVTPKASYSRLQKEALVQPNIGVIDTIHQGFAYSYRNPPYRSGETTFPYYARFRALSRLLALQAQARQENGEWSGAADSSLDAMRMGEDIPYGSAIIGDLVGVACQAIGRRQMWKVDAHLNAAQSRAAVRRLEGILAAGLPYADTLQEEKWAMQAILLEGFRNPRKWDVPAAEGKKGAEEPNTGQSSPLFYLVFSKSRIMSNYTVYMDQLMDQARRPYGLHLPPPPAPSDPVNRIMLPIFPQARLKYVENQTQNDLLLITLALHAFQLEHGRYPASLLELAPTYLKKLPDDPYAAQGTFKYLVKGKSYLLYSVGPDGRDDGGTPIDDPKSASSANPNSRYFVNQNSVGDVVAGTNQW